MKSKFCIGFDQKLADIGLGIENKERNELVLHPLEYTYAVEKKIIEADEKAKSEAEKIKSELKTEYAIFKGLREKGYIVRDGPDEYYRIYRKGFRRNQDRTMYLMRILKNAEELNAEVIKKDLEISLKMRKDLVYALAGKDGKISFYSIAKKLFS